MTSSLMIYRKKRKSQPSAVVLRKYRRLRRRRVGLKKEYKKLKALLPHTGKEREMKKVGVVEAAYRYICELQDALLDKFSSRGVPEDLAGIVHGKVTSAADIQALAVHLIKNSASYANNPVLSRSSSVGLTAAGGRDREDMEMAEGGEKGRQRGEEREGNEERELFSKSSKAVPSNSQFTLTHPASSSSSSFVSATFTSSCSSSSCSSPATASFTTSPSLSSSPSSNILPLSNILNRSSQSGLSSCLPPLTSTEAIPSLSLTTSNSFSSFNSTVASPSSSCSL